MNNTGALVISLDFELLWGVFDKVDWREKREYFRNTRRVIPEILLLFNDYEISCTWATVGMLFNESWDEWNHNIPGKIPAYHNSRLSAYDFGKSIQGKETEEFCFAPDLIQQIKETPGQELGTHTYSHYYCLEPGQTSEDFEADILKSKELAKKIGMSFKSLVFPRNQYNKEYLNICKDSGLRTVRTNPDVWYWKNNQEEKITQKIFRTGEAYVGFNDKSYSKVSEILPGIVGQKSSRFLRPNAGRSLLDKLRIERIKNEMLKAAKNNEIYHLWWHPHNFGVRPEKNLEELKFLLSFFKTCQQKYNMKSLHMMDVVKQR